MAARLTLPVSERDGALRLEALGAMHEAVLHTLIAENIARLQPWMGWATPGYARSETRSFLSSMENDTRVGRVDPYLIVVDGAAAGVIDLHGIDRTSRSAMIGYWLGGRFEGRGVMSAAVRRILARAFAELGLNRIEIRAAVENARSRAIPERLGFTHEGVLREAIWVAGRPQNLAVYSLLAREWAQIDRPPVSV